MTHDELLAKIKDNYWIDKPQESLGYSSPEAWSALRAVVELHKPEHLDTGYRCAWDYELFPCKHHQAIEKELR